MIILYILEKTFLPLFSTASRYGSVLNKTSKKKNTHTHTHLYSPDKNFYHFSKSIISLINLIVGSRNVIKISNIVRLSKLNKRQEFFVDNFFAIFFLRRLSFLKVQWINRINKVIQQISFTASLDRERNTRIYFILEGVKETAFIFSQQTMKVL